MSAGAPGRSTAYAAAAAVMLVSLLPFARGLLAGQSFFFRDLGGYFFPLRLFALAGLRQGELRYWSPLTHEGEPLALLPVAYPFDLLQALVPTETGLSFILALHLPLAALGAFLLARHLGLGLVGACASALSYALGGFALSCLNLYVYAQALAWAPFVIRGLGRAAQGPRREIGKAALALSLALTTTGIEIVAQAAVMGLLLARPRDRGALGRTGLVLLLGLGLGAAVVLPVSALVAESARGRGFPTEVVLAHSLHPITLLQTLVAGLYGDTARLTDTFWGQNYFPRGFPYFLSVYMGALGLGLAALGACTKGTPRVLGVLAALSLVVCLGRYAGLTALVDALPALHRFRFPAKAFFTVHLSVAMLTGFALEALARRGSPLSWKRASQVLGAVGLVVALAPSLALRPLGLRRYLVAGFFPPDLDLAARLGAAASIASDALAGGGLALLGALLAYATFRGRLPAAKAALLLTALLATDLLRGGAGLNPMVSPAFFSPSAEASRLAASVREGGGRLFSYDPGYSPAYYAARARRPGEHEVWSFAVLQEALVPHYNLALSVPSALGLDQTMLAPEARILAPEDAEPSALPRIVDRLRDAAVTHVVAAEPLSHPDLEPAEILSPARIAPLRLFVYRLKGAHPRFELSSPGGVLASRETPGHLRIEAEAQEAGTLLLRDAWARGWRVSVDDLAQPLLRTERGQRAVALPPGRHRVDFDYAPPGLLPGLTLSAASALVVLLLLRGGPRLPSLPASRVRLGPTPAATMRRTRGPRTIWPSSRSSRRASVPHGCRGSLSRRSTENR